jgi:peptidoglycan hydrolase-like protein with peptidoglycan-binding domain
MPTSVQLGSTGDDVKRLQRALARLLAWNPFGPITGNFDASLDAAVRAFQQSNGLTVDGVVGPETWVALPNGEPSPTYRIGATSPVIGRLQNALAGGVVAVQFTPYNGPIDGVFGPLTEAAVRSLQTWAGKTVDGVVGDETWFIWLTPGSAQQLTLERACAPT